MIWTMLPFGIVLLLIAGILLSHAFGAGLLYLLCQQEHSGGRKPAASPRRTDPQAAGAVIYRGVLLKLPGC
jgi:hypothetical protein